MNVAKVITGVGVNQKKFHCKDKLKRTIFFNEHVKFILL